MSRMTDILVRYRSVFAWTVRAGIVMGIGGAVLYFISLNQKREEYRPGTLIDILSKYHTEVAFLIEVGVTIGIIAAFLYFPAQCRRKEGTILHHIR